jgi:hypothetical protein
VKLRTTRIALPVLFIAFTAGLGCGRSALETEDVEQTTSALTSGAVSVDCGGPALGSFVADTGFSGGATLTRTNTIDVSGVVNAPPMGVYQSQRYNNMSYTFGGFAAGASNVVRLHFADTKWTTTNQRLFNVKINATQVLTNYDVIAAAGGPNKAVAPSFTVAASSSGQYVIQLVGTKDAAMISGIEIGAPDVVQIQTYIDQRFYSTNDITSSFISQGEQIDCINFNAQHSVKAWIAAGVAIPTTFPAAPARPSTMAPPNVGTSQGFTGQLDVNGHAMKCASTDVPVMRPTVAQIQAMGGLAAYQLAAQRQPHLKGAQSPIQHDCWIDDAPGDGSPIGSDNAVDWEHASGVQTSGWAGGATGFFGMHVTTPIYTPFVHANVTQFPEHTDSQLWAQTGTCDNWYNSAADLATKSETKNQCRMGTACTTCVGAACNGCAVQSLEVVALANAGDTPRLEVFFTSDGYFLNDCYVNHGLSCGGCPSGTDCFVATPGATFTPHMRLTPAASTGTGPYGVVPSEKEFAVWNGSGAGAPGWSIYVDGQTIGWLPAKTFNWPNDNTPGPMSAGPATYLQAGGEVFDTWPGGQHTDTSMVSDNDAAAGYKYAAYQRSISYYDAAKVVHDASLVFAAAPASEGDLGIGGICGLDSASWATASGAPGAYSLSTTTPPGAAGWGQYFYFGGGILGLEKPPVGPVSILYHQYDACSTIPGTSPAGPNASYVVLQIDGFGNAGSSTIPFHFDQTKLYTVDPHTGHKDYVNPTLPLYPDVFGPFAAVATIVPANTSERFQTPEDIGLIVTTTTADGPAEASQRLYQLQYDHVPGDPPVVLFNSSSTTFPPVQDDCTKIGLVTTGP